ncbi:hypothetical protein BD311DRAFT_764346 [Dichomitus squalens]|uniref:Uncharacterized protein n=1 Tax=Dichomitus squalens TaxID=114155 RepID=A0A4Q9MHT7_9APHY|nr:hypothetical protein BD311DRAFT_764346 [Dichomitus squalens]
MYSREVLMRRGVQSACPGLLSATPPPTLCPYPADTRAFRHLCSRVRHREISTGQLALQTATRCYIGRLLCRHPSLSLP